MLEAVYPRALWRCKASQHPVPEASNLLCWLISESQFQLTTHPVPTVWARWLAGVGGTTLVCVPIFRLVLIPFWFCDWWSSYHMSLIPGKCNAMKLTSQMYPLRWWMLLQEGPVARPNAQQGSSIVLSRPLLMLSIVLHQAQCWYFSLVWRTVSTCLQFLRVWKHSCTLNVRWQWGLNCFTLLNLLLSLRATEWSDQPSSRLLLLVY
jgi:hypothetical protein